MQVGDLSAEEAHCPGPCGQRQGLHGCCHFMWGLVPLKLSLWLGGWGVWQQIYTFLLYSKWVGFFLHHFVRKSQWSCSFSVRNIFPVEIFRMRTGDSVWSFVI